MATFSVIIPAYNASNTLAEVLLSVKKQTFTDWEVIVVDDGSTDITSKVFEEIVDGDPRFKIIKQENHGLGAARNKAAAQSTAKWLVFLDADDTWSANKLSILDQFIQGHPEAQMMYHPVFELYPNGRMRLRKWVEAPDVDIFINKQNPFVPSAVAISKEVFFAAGGFVEDRQQVEDLMLWLKLYHQGIKPVAINRALTVYRIGSGLTQNIAEHLAKVENSIREAEKQKLITTAQTEIFLERKNYEAARQLHKLGDFDNALVYYHQLKNKDFKTKLLTIFCSMKWAL